MVNVYNNEKTSYFIDEKNLNGYIHRQHNQEENIQIKSKRTH